MNSINNRVVVTVLGIFISVLFSISDGREALAGPPRQGRLFFPLPGFGNPAEGLQDLLNCRPFNRTFVQHGVLCLQPNMTAINCRNQTCVCTGVSTPGLPGAGQLLPLLPFPTPSIPNLPTVPGIGGGRPSMSTWSCIVSPVNITLPSLPPSISPSTPEITLSTIVE